MWLQIIREYCHNNQPLKNQSFHDDNVVVTDVTGCYRHEKLRSRQWRQICHHALISLLSICVKLNKINLMIVPKVENQYTSHTHSSTIYHSFHFSHFININSCYIEWLCQRSKIDMHCTLPTNCMYEIRRTHQLAIQKFSCHTSQARANSMRYSKIVLMDLIYIKYNIGCYTVQCSIYWTKRIYTGRGVTRVQYSFYESSILYIGR